MFIHTPTEDYELYRNDSLYRRTTGFHGDLAFDVAVEDENPPNVLLVVVESFRYHDSRYLVGEGDPSDLFKGSNITITPNFDKWAEQGVAFTNMWSSWRTSRSVGSLLFGQVPYDSSVANSGMSGGRKKYQLYGLPQFFTDKGYESFFTTGSRTDYDDWKTFLLHHGFDTVWGRDEFTELAESDLGINQHHWFGKERRGLYWGVHDDVSFQLLGDLMMNKTKDQRERIAQGEAKKPLSSRTTRSPAMCHTMSVRVGTRNPRNLTFRLFIREWRTEKHQKLPGDAVFSDLELGKFMYRMSSEGILGDTIVVIVGDHGQAPEAGNYIPEARDVSFQHVTGALVAEGRLDSPGLEIDDAAEQYDIMNTLADIVGVPKGGFIQDGVGRSLKRKVKFGERVVYSNNPSRKMSIVRGTERLR